MIDRITKDPSTSFFENYAVLDRISLLEKCPLSTKSEFWAELQQQKALYDTEICLAVYDRSVLSEESLNLLDQLKSCSSFDPDEAKNLLRYSSDINMGTIYKLRDIENIMKNNEIFKKEIQDLVEDKKLKLDKIGKILVVPESLSYFSDFDGVTTDDLKDFFNLNQYGAGWIMNQLQQHGILQLQTVLMTRLTANNEQWEKLVRIHLSNNPKKIEKTDPIELKLLSINAGVLQRIKDNRKLLNVTEDVLNQFCQIPDNLDRTETIKKFYKYLAEQNILEQYLYNIWRLNSKLDCSSLPRCIVDQIDEFLADRFAYTFALEELCQSLKAATEETEINPRQLFLPENPIAELYEDLFHCGLAMPSRLCTTTNTTDEIDYEDFEHEETIKSVISSNRLKLFDQTDYHLDFVSFSTYVSDQGFLIDSDLRAIMNNGLKFVITKKKEKAGWWLLNTIISGAAWCWNQIKSAASAVASFCYSCVKFVTDTIGKNDKLNLNSFKNCSFLFRNGSQYNI